jgi:hypothetical protein
MSRDSSSSRARRAGAGLLALLALAGSGARTGAEEPARPASGPARKVATRPWFAVPAGARNAIWKLARSEGVTPTTYDVFEQDGQYVYEFHATRRSGLFLREEVILCSMSEPAATAAERKEARSLRGRLRRLGERLGGADDGVPTP